MEIPSKAELEQMVLKAHNAGNIEDARAFGEMLNTYYPEEATVASPIIADISRENLVSQLEDASTQVLTNDTGQVVETQNVGEDVVEETKPYTILADFEDGRFVYEMANGTRVYIDQKEGFTTTEPKYIESALAEYEASLKGAYEGKTVADLRKYDDAKNIYDQSPGMAWLDRFAQSPLFVGKGMDEAAGFVGDLLGKDGERIKSDIEARADAYGVVNPKLAMTTDIGGAIGTAIPVMFAMPGTFYAWLATLPIATGIGVTSLASGGFNAIEGYVSGYLGGEEGQRQTDAIDLAMKQGMIGTIAGPFGWLAPKWIAYGWHRVRNGILESPIDVIQDAFGISIGAAKVLKDTLLESGEDFMTVLRNMKKGGNQQMIADATEATKVLTDAVGAAGGEASEIVQKNIIARSQQASSTLEKSLDKNLATLGDMPGTKGVKKDAKQVALEQKQATQKPRSKAYKDAYEYKVDYNSAEGKQILDVLQRMPVDLKRAALKEANDILRMKGDEFGQINMVVGDDGLFKMVNNPNMLQLDYIKRALSDLAYDPLKKGGLSSHANTMRFELTQVLKKINKKYEKALKLGQENITRNNAIEIGEEALKSKTTVASLARKLNDKNIGREEREMVALGVRAELDRMIGNVKATATKNADVQAMQKLWKDLSSKSARQKLRLLIPKTKEYKAIIKELDKAEAALNLQAAVNMNSKTHIRGVIEERIKESAEGGAIRALMQGEKGLTETSGRLLDKIFRSEVINKRQMAIITKELANAMTGIKGTKAHKLYKELYTAVKNKALDDRQLQELTNFMFSRLKMMPQIASVQAVTSATEE